VYANDLITFWLHVPFCDVHRVFCGNLVWNIYFDFMLTQVRKEYE
jgi:hypothetical protein